MKTELISLTHKKHIDQLLLDCPHTISEFCFATLYLFRKKYQIKVINDSYLEGKTTDSKHYIMPLTKALFQDKERFFPLLQDKEFAFPIPESWLAFYKDEIDTAIYLESESDYLFETEKLAHFRGLSKKRNLEKQFLTKYTPYQRPLDATTNNDALQVIENWQKNSPHSETDYEAAKEAITLFKELDLEGLVVYVNTMPVGIIIGGFLSSQVFVIQIAKADKEYKGLYQYMFHQFCQTVEGRAKIINMEQDLGNPNLKKTKHSYHPIKLEKKYRVVFKNLKY